MNTIEDKLMELWKNRKSDPLGIANEISEVMKEKNFSVHKIALILGTRAAEVAVYQNLAALDTKAQRYFKEYNLPASLALDLVNEEEDVQNKILNKLCDNLSNETDIYEKFESIINEEKTESISWRAEIGPEHIMHLSTKAKSYNILSAKQRKALFSIGLQLKKKKKLSSKQRNYLNDLLDKCKEKKLISDSCYEEQCGLCNYMVNLINKK
ncbi:MAG: hypothetical protein GF364_02545 [Candidatus Lokiarchaeota archaeon]|nr:hypothetical protein [Candidatus Lokiarchaeota archaeon]